MKITCEHCGAMIDTEYEKKCSNCGAPYSNNKEYKRKKELEEQEREVKLRTHEIGNEIAEETLKKFKTASKISPIFMIIVFAIAIFIFFIIFKQIYNSFDRYNNIDNSNNSQQNNNYDEFERLRIVGQLEMYSGKKNGFQIKYLLDIIIKENFKNTVHTIKVTYNDNILSNNEDILDLVNDIDEEKNYYVMFSYDSNKYIDNANISEIK